MNQLDATQYVNSKLLIRQGIKKVPCVFRRRALHIISSSHPSFETTPCYASSLISNTLHVHTHSGRSSHSLTHSPTHQISLCCYRLALEQHATTTSWIVFLLHLPCRLLHSSHCESTFHVCLFFFSLSSLCINLMITCVSFSRYVYSRGLLRFISHLLFTRRQKPPCSLFPFRLHSTPFFFFSFFFLVLLL